MATKILNRYAVATERCCPIAKYIGCVDRRRRRRRRRLRRRRRWRRLVSMYLRIQFVASIYLTDSHTISSLLM